MVLKIICVILNVKYLFVFIIVFEDFDVFVLKYMLCKLEIMFFLFVRYKVLFLKRFVIFFIRLIDFKKVVFFIKKYNIKYFLFFNNNFIYFSRIFFL